jgi:hypothetical protein
MSREVRFSSVVGRRPQLRDFATPTVRLDRRAGRVTRRDHFNLRPARGVLTGVLLGALCWAAILLLIWLSAG